MKPNASLPWVKRRLRQTTNNPSALNYQNQEKRPSSPMEISIQDALIQLSQRLTPYGETAQLDAQVLVAHHLGKSRSWVLAHPEVILNRSQFKNISQSACRVEKGEPLPYLLGHWEFYQLDFIVTPDVLIPRPETELLVERSINWLRQHPHKRKVLDVGTGSGCIGIAIARHVPDVHLVMADISQEALGIARRNAEKHGILDSVEFHKANLLEGIPGPFDLISANLPYIPTQELERMWVARHEPRLALDGGDRGVDVIASLLEQAKGRLIAGGMLLLEIEESSGAELEKLARKAYPQSSIEILQDLPGKDRCIQLERPGRIAHLCRPQEWFDQRQLAEFRDQSLLQNGFIHCSQLEQIIEVANRYYGDQPEMVILWIDPDKLASGVRWEITGNIYYPHIYGPINLDAIEAATPLCKAYDGVYRTIFASET
jgi:release factor glutamine methyltransferase